ncbi:ATP-binding protein [Paraburkholderia guartelaensis]|uniref:ATP-binding protein n=1 Tax=Paraburkholderia guartelaensis TaxID=2546446 RepID=UPI002AB75426|nr:ATP-binding protein [Paraburkholderia guartelaensis]
MSDLSNWLDNNTRYLANAVAAVRELLEEHSRPADSVAGVRPQAAPRDGAAGSGWRFFGRKPSREILPLAQDAVVPAAPVTVAASAAAAGPGDGNSASVGAQSDPLAVGPAMTPPPALLLLGERLGLSRFELKVLLLCIALELDTRIAGLCARAQADPARPWPTFALALALFDQPSWEALSPERPLRRWRLLEISQPGALPLTVSPMRADERIVNYVKGLNYLDDRLGPLVSAVPPTELQTGLPASQQRVVDGIVRQFVARATMRGLPVVQLVGVDAGSRELVAASAARALGLQLYRLPAGLLPAQTAELENFVRLWQRESLLLPIGLYLDAGEPAGEGAQGVQAAMVAELLERITGVVLVGTTDVRQVAGRMTVPVDVARPEPAEQQAAWAAVLGTQAGDLPQRLAGQFNLGIATIERIAGRALSDASTQPAGNTAQQSPGSAQTDVAQNTAETARDTPVADPADETQADASASTAAAGADADAADTPALFERLWSASLDESRPRLERLAQHIDTKATWSDIVLPAAESTLLRQIADQVRQRSTVYDAWGFRSTMSRGLGINALFAGGSGTGKTMAAEVLANDLHLSLHRIDLSAVVSKYIGESEKNLRRLFDAAEDAGCILFFDEADALFGRRSEVKDSHDRYANIEINYLLQRMEAYRGLAILATNMKSALDPAFLRRLRFVVNFPFPGVAERKAIWQKVFPSSTPTAALDYERLARLNLTGGHIHNIGLNAAFLAAQAGSVVTMPLILDAARTEFRKLDKAINEADFRWTPVTGTVA